MIKILVVLLWPAGLAAIVACGALLARRRGSARGQPAAGTGGSDSGPGRTGPDLARFVLLLVAGSGVVYGIMAALGIIVVHDGPAIDRPIFTWTVAHRVPAWAHLMADLTKIGDTWTTWGASLAAAACLGVAWRRQRWLPVAALVTVIVIDHYVAFALRQTFHRPGPPGSPGGTYPSGGVDRVFLIYGLIAYLLWHEFSQSRRAAVWAGTVVAALGFNEAYSRAYLTLHWFTDTLAGILDGCLLLAVFVIAVRLVSRPGPGPAGAGPARTGAAGARPARASPG
jgi:membrane-associated phospholipid phosphatase